MILKKLRIGISCVVILLSVLIFLEGEHVSSMLSHPFLFFQFTPSLINFFLSAGVGISLGFVVILILTFVFGRVYCACLCPLGIFQDALSFLAKKFFKGTQPRKRSYQQPSLSVRYSILGVTAFFSILGSLAILNLLDPYSLFGRMTTHLLRPIVFLVNNVLVAALEAFDIYTLAHLSLPTVSLSVLVITLIFFLVLLGMAAFRGRLYCNTICPVGALLAIVSRFSLVKMEIKQTACTSCKRCERACRAECINVAEYMIDESRCVRCFDCLALCPEAAIEYRTFGPLQQQVTSVDPGRRRFVLGSASAAGTLMLLGLPLRRFSKQIFRKIRSTPIPTTPPGSLSFEHFAASCTACHLCVSACPSHVIHPAFMEYGLQGIMQPTMNYQEGYCHYDCHTCGQVCPTGAILPLELPRKQLTQIGKAELVKDRCIVYDRDEDCGACAEVCPTHAVYTIEKNNIFYPETNLELCIGCGACEFVCPQGPKAIFVKGNAVHATAKEPFYDQEPVKAPVQEETDEDFPF